MGLELSKVWHGEAGGGPLMVDKLVRQTFKMEETPGTFLHLRRVAPLADNDR